MACVLPPHIEKSVSDVVKRWSGMDLEKTAHVLLENAPPGPIREALWHMLARKVPYKTASHFLQASEKMELALFLRKYLPSKFVNDVDGAILGR